MGESAGSCVSDPLTSDFVDELVDVSLSLLAQLRQAGNVVFGSLGLTYSQAMLLIFVERGFTRPKELAGLLGVVFPALSSLVTNLADGGLVTRVLDPADGRRVEILLTPAGTATCFKIRQAWRDLGPLDVSRFGEAQVDTFLNVARAAMKPESH